MTSILAVFCRVHFLGKRLHTFPGVNFFGTKMRNLASARRQTTRAQTALQQQSGFLNPHQTTKMIWKGLAFRLAVMGSLVSEARTRSQSDGSDRVRLEDVKVRVADSRFTSQARTPHLTLQLNSSFYLFLCTTFFGTSVVDDKTYIYEFVFIC